MNFSLIGASGYIASRHIDAIEKLGGKIVIYHDITRNFSLEESGVKFIESEDNFFDFIKNNKIDYCVICCPNFLHFKMICLSLNAGSEVISEKPLCLTSEELYEIEKISSEKKLNVYTIMQLRLHPVAEKLRNLADHIQKNNLKQKSIIKFITPRDNAYLNSWKTNKELSGGILFNLGIHYFDLLIQAFGEPIESNIEYIDSLNAKGLTKFKNLDVDWIFSIVPSNENKINPERVFTINKENINFSKVDNDLHVENYIEILNHKNFSIANIKDTMNFMFNLNKE